MKGPKEKFLNYNLIPFIYKSNCWHFFDWVKQTGLSVVELHVCLRYECGFVLESVEF
jgi:hypothetical protein